MAQATSPFPLQYPGDARPALTGDDVLRRMGKQLAQAQDGRALAVGRGALGLGCYLARELGTRVTVAVWDDASVEEIAERVRAQGLEDQVEARRVEGAQDLPFPAADFQAVIVDPSAPLPLLELLSTLRPLLAPRGRLLATWPVRVGRVEKTPLLSFWEKKLGQPLALPREILQHLERAGYEPQIIETLEDPELDAFYRHLDQHAEGDPALTEEIALFRAQGGRSAASFATFVGRRKEPGEKPPPSRTE